MKRAVLVGLAGACLALLLVSVATYVELRHTQFGPFMRDSAVEMRNDHVSNSYLAKYGDGIDFLGRWVRPNQLIVDPALYILVGAFVGLLSRRVLVSSLIAGVPIVAINWLPDLLGAFSIALCLLVCGSIAAGTRHALERRSEISAVPAPVVDSH